MRTFSINISLFKTSIFRTILGVSFLISALLLAGCGQGLSGQAIGEDVEDIEILRQEVSDLSDSISKLAIVIRNLEAAKDTEDIRALEQEILGTSNRLDNMRESISAIEDTFDVINTSVSDLASLVEYVDQTKSSEVLDNFVGETGVNSDEIAGLATADEVIRPTTLTVVFDYGVDGKTWGDGIYVRCTSGSHCGHLNGPTIHGREVYVKLSGVTSDSNHRWYYAYIFLKQTGSQTWPIQYVVPSSQWMAHRYFDSDNPWGDWGDLTVTANYN